MQIQKGSGIVCVLITMAGLLTIMSLVIRYTTYGIDIAHQRAVYEQHYFALKGLLNYGIMLAEQMRIPEESPTYLNPWLKEYTGKLVFSADQTHITIHAYLHITSQEFIDMEYRLPKDAA